LTLTFAAQDACRRGRKAINPALRWSGLVHGRYVAGVILVALGILFILDELNYIAFGTAFERYWPVILIVLGVVHLATQPGRPAGGLVLMGIGTFFLLRNFDRLPENAWNLVWPFLLILIGISILFPRARRHHRSHDGHHGHGRTNTTSEPRLSRSAVLGGFDERITSRPFLGGSVSAFMGGGKLDFRDAELPPEGADLEANATLGGLEIIVPATWRVEVSGNPFLGGIDNRTSATGASGPTLRVKASAFMGGVDIKN
jgi:predicted membrane protein